MKRTVVAVLLLVLLAGCFSSSTSTTTTITTSIKSTTTKHATTTTTTTTTQPTTTTVEYDNPWGTEVITVGVRNQASNRSISPLVEQTIHYWESNAPEYADYEPDYKIVNPNKTQPDILVKLVPVVQNCDSSTNGTTLGCAPLLYADSNVYGTQTIQIRAGYTDNSTLTTLKHEFGHTLGLEHDDQPQPLMAAYGDANRLAMRNASELPYPWLKTNLTVYATAGDGWSKQEVKRETDKLIQYYNSGAQGMIAADLNLTYAVSPENADILIRYNDSLGCRFGGGGVCSQGWGYSEDADRALEYYTYAEITVVKLDQQNTGGWFASYALANYMGGQAVERYPLALRKQKYADDSWYE